MTITMNTLDMINKDLRPGELSEYGITIMKFEQKKVRYVKIENNTSKSNEAFADMMERIARFFDMAHVKTIVRNNEVYLINCTVH